MVIDDDDDDDDENDVDDAIMDDLQDEYVPQCKQIVYVYEFSRFRFIVFPCIPFFEKITPPTPQRRHEHAIRDPVTSVEWTQQTKSSQVWDMPGERVGKVIEPHTEQNLN